MPSTKSGALQKKNVGTTYVEHKKQQFVLNITMSGAEMVILDELSYKWLVSDLWSVCFVIIILEHM